MRLQAEIKFYESLFAYRDNRSQFAAGVLAEAYIDIMQDKHICHVCKGLGVMIDNLDAMSFTLYKSCPDAVDNILQAIAKLSVQLADALLAKTVSDAVGDYVGGGYDDDNR
jgi:hypothetical protein